MKSDNAVSKPITTDQLIAQSKRAQGTAMPCEAALVQLRKACAHNDSLPQNERLNAQQVILMLRSYGWSGNSRETLRDVCRRIGRVSFQRAS